jgi:LysM repeat protein
MRQIRYLSMVVILLVLGLLVAPAAVYAVDPTPTPNAEGLIVVAVQPGDTMWSIAARAGLTLDQLLELNPPLTRDSFINAGDQLIIGRGELPAAEPTAVASPETAETEAEDGDSTDAPALQATTVPTPEATAAPVLGATVCLRAFEDVNRDGLMNGSEGLRPAVAFTIADGEQVISNYVTDGVSEPYCIEGLPAGTYRISRSLGPNEQPSNAPDWALALTDGAEFSLDFGSYMEEAASIIVPTEAEVVNASTTNTSVEEASTAAQTTAETAASETAAAAEQVAADPGLSSANLVTWVIVGIAAVLLVGVILVVLSGRRA